MCVCVWGGGIPGVAHARPGYTRRRVHAHRPHTAVRRGGCGDGHARRFARRDNTGCALTPLVHDHNVPLHFDPCDARTPPHARWEPHPGPSPGPSAVGAVGRSCLPRAEAQELLLARPDDLERLHDNRLADNLGGRRITTCVCTDCIASDCPHTLKVYPPLTSYGAAPGQYTHVCQVLWQA